MSERRSPYSHGRSEVWERRGFVTALKREARRLGENVRALRLDRGWTQSEAAEAVGVHPVQVSRIEAGEARVSLPTLVGLALAFGVEVSALFAPKVVGENSATATSPTGRKSR